MHLPPIVPNPLALRLDSDNEWAIGKPLWLIPRNNESVQFTSPDAVSDTGAKSIPESLAKPQSHTRDPMRAEDFLLSISGTDERGLKRDWNEELQSIRDMPNESHKDRTIRLRSLLKYHNEYVAASARGAVSVLRGKYN